MNFSEQLRKIRSEKGLSQKKLADLSGLSQAAIYQWEKGTRKPKFEQCEKLAIALKVSPAIFFDDNDNETQRLKAYFEKLQNLDQKRATLIIELLKTHGYKIEEKNRLWLTITDHQGFSFLANRVSFDEMIERSDRDIRYNIEKLINESQQITKNTAPAAPDQVVAAAANPDQDTKK